ncbi:hypothetical protein OUZ56_004309 [Daphnia magna]|uniref:Uncharacterized protein n=1 Tax=Daphnia magna TaxID=35525 RepID=A0ABQ9YPR6_9CRUS|nr:hypothetical protein OUZ56_004309 [Daphnia magna]
MSRKQSDSTLSTFPTSEFVRSYPDVSNQFRILFGRIVAVQMETDLRSGPFCTSAYQRLLKGFIRLALSFYSEAVGRLIRGGDDPPCPFRPTPGRMTLRMPTQFTTFCVVLH